MVRPIVGPIVPESTYHLDEISRALASVAALEIVEQRHNELIRALAAAVIHLLIEARSAPR